MPLPSPPLLLDRLLARVPRRYRLPPLVEPVSEPEHAGPAWALAMAIERAREAIAQGTQPSDTLEQQFIAALARLVQDAMRAQPGDPAFQAMVLRHHDATVRDYASLSVRADQDRRQLLAAVGAIAHPGKQQRMAPGPLRESLAQLQACAEDSDWARLQQTVQSLLAGPQLAGDEAMEDRLRRLLDQQALVRLQRIDFLAAEPRVQQYRALWERHGPRAGSATASAQGASSRRRGEAAEAIAARALQALAQRLDRAEGNDNAYRAVTSMRVPSSIPASHARAKTEWDAVLLRRADTAGELEPWHVCLLVEVKASVDAATTDLPRLLRGLRLLAHAEADVTYAFETQQGTVPLSGASLRQLSADEPALARTVLYCCDAAGESAPRVLGAATRMQLLSSPATLDFAAALTAQRDADLEALRALWRELLSAPRWQPVLHQLPQLRQVRELMVHTDDLLAAIESLDQP
ncbi:3-deoxy-D-arabino-heptulosonate 7-phosphate synthase [Paracidovorax citrulli]